MSVRNYLKEGLSCLGFRLCLVVVTDIAVAGWLILSPNRASAYVAFFGF